MRRPDTVRPSRRGRPRRGPHISISATDEEWAGVRRDAARRGISIARYFAELAERDGDEEAPSMALAASEQRELLAAVREVRSLLLEGADAAPLVRDMQERVAVGFRAWARTLARSGRGDVLMEALVAVLGEDRAREAAAALTEPERRAAAPRPAPDPGERLL